MRFRPAVQDDLPAILELVLADRYASTREDASNLECYQGAFERIQQSPDNELIVGVLDGCIVATLQLTFIPGLTYEGGWRAHLGAMPTLLASTRSAHRYAPLRGDLNG